MLALVSPITGRELMPTFILMTRLAAEGLHDASGRRARGKAWVLNRKLRLAPGLPTGVHEHANPQFHALLDSSPLSQS